MEEIAYTAILTRRFAAMIYSQSNWYLPSGERVLGGYEYDDIRVGVFARSSGFRSQSYSPPVLPTG